MKHGRNRPRANDGKPNNLKRSPTSNLADTRIGSGSDHTVFLNFVGMPVLGLRFDGLMASTTPPTTIFSG